MSIDDCSIASKGSYFNELLKIQKEVKKIFLYKPGLDGDENVDKIFVRLERGKVVFKKKGLFSCVGRADNIDIQSARKLKELFSNFKLINLINSDRKKLDEIRNLAELTHTIVSRTLEHHRKKNPSQMVNDELSDLQTEITDALDKINDVESKIDAYEILWSNLHEDYEVKNSRSLNKIKAIISEYPELVNIPNAEGSFLLCKACEFGKLEIVKVLLKCKNIDLDCRDHGKTPLHLAVETGRNEIIELLVLKGANVNFRDSEDNTTLHSACKRVLSILCLLDGHDIDINAKDKHGNTPLLYEVENLRKAIDSIVWYESMLNMLEIDLKVQEQFDNKLSEKRKYIDKLSKDKDLLEVIVRNVAHLLENGANPTIQNNAGVTPLTVLIECNFEFLQNHDLTKKYFYIIKLLIDYGAKTNTKSGDDSVFTKLIRYSENHKDLCLQDSTSDLVSLVIKRYDETATRFLKKINIDICKTAADSYGNTPLHTAALARNIQLIDELIGKVEYIDAINHQGETALHIACRKGLIVPRLIDASNSINVKDSKGDTSLLLATSCFSDSVNKLVGALGHNRTLENVINELSIKLVDNDNPEDREKLDQFSRKWAWFNFYQKWVTLDVRKLAHF